MFNDGRRYLAANPAYCALPGYTREEITELRAGHNLVLDEVGEADFIHRITDGHHLGEARDPPQGRNAVPVSYMLIPSQVSELPCYIGLVWPQPA